MKNTIKFCYISLFIFGLIFLFIPILNIFGLYTKSYQAFDLNIPINNLLLPLLFFFILALLNLSAAYFIYKLKPIGKTLGMILGILGLLPLQSVALYVSLWLILSFLGLEILKINFINYGIPIIILMLYHAFIFDILLKNKTYFNR